MGKKRFIFSGFPNSHEQWTGNDPHSLIAEKNRKQLINTMLVALTMNADKELAAIQFSGILMGTMTGCTCGVIGSYRGSESDLRDAFRKIADEAFLMAMAIEKNKEAVSQGAPS